MNFQRISTLSLALLLGSTATTSVWAHGDAHEFSLGTQKELREHYALMKKFPDMVHEEANKVTLEPGQKGEVIWKFTQPGVVDFACLHPGHYDAGMKGQIQVAKTR